jgi:hypothetical protein
VNLSPEVREALEDAQAVAQHNVNTLQGEWEQRAAAAERAQADLQAAHQTLAAIQATLNIDPEVDDKYRTFGE